MRGFKNTQGTFFHCSEIGERNWVLRIVGSGDVGPAARTVSKNPSQRLDTGIIPTPWWFTPECEQQLMSIGEDGKIPSSIKPEAPSPDISELTEEQLRAKLKAQLEYYFSRENLNQDRYLRSQMDTDQYVQISVVAGFPKISKLTSDLDLILSVLKESSNVQVDDTNTKVRAAHRRCTLLLREIPEFTDEREVKAMFIGCPPYTSLSYGLNNSWYVTFESEEATQLAFLHLQNLRKSFNGKQICVRIKTGSAPLSEPPNIDHGRCSPSKNDFTSLGPGVSTITTSKGFITAFPSHAAFVLNPNSSCHISTEREICLDQLMGPYGYAIRAIYQPKDSEPPAMNSDRDTVTAVEGEKKPSNTDGKSVLGPPSTEIVGSLLSAAAEANETKKREREVQQKQWQQIMDGLTPMPSLTGGQRITDMPFIKRPVPVLHRYVSQESSDIEVALDIQRAARKQEKEAKQQQQLAQQAPPQQYSKPHQQYHDNYRVNNKTYDTSKNYSDRNSNTNVQTKDHYYNNGYSSGERSSYDKTGRYQNSSYRDARKTDRNGGGKGSEYYNNYKQQSREKSGEKSSYNSTAEKNYSNTSNNYYHDRSYSNYNRRDTDTGKPRYQQQNFERKHLRTYQTPQSQIQTTSYTIPENLVENPSPVDIVERAQTPATTPPELQPSLPVVVVPSNAHSDTASTTSSSRRKDNSESSEYNFVDGDFPSLIEKERKAVVKEKAKFSAIVAGKNKDVKKSYAQTLTKT